MRAHVAVRKGQLALEGLSPMKRRTREESELDVLELVKPRERPRSVGGRVPGREEDGLHSSARS